MRMRLAPSAERTANSWARALERASSRFGHIDACNQENKSDCPEQHQQQRLHLAYEILAQRNQVGANAVVGLRVRLLQADR